MLQALTEGYGGLQRVNKGYKRLQKLQGVRGNYKRLQQVTEG